MKNVLMSLSVSVRTKLRRKWAAGWVVVWAMACACAAAPVDVELETYAVLDGRAELNGQVTVKSAGAVGELLVCAVPVHGERAVWSTVVGLAGLKRGQSARFSIPVGKMQGGYYRLEVPGTADVMPPPPDFRGAMVFSIASLREKPPAVPADKSDRRFLSFVLDAVKTLVERQSARLGGEPDGTLFLTCSRFSNRGYRSLGYRKDDGSYSNFWFPEMPMDYQPFMVDFDLWPILERLSELTGEGSYRERVGAMARAFVAHGFDARSGLGYLGEEASFDVVRKTVVPTKVRATAPQFKPKNTGNFPAMPLEALWRHGPAQMHRMFRAMYYGLITDAASMDYNRYCGYDFSDADKRHSMKRNSGHCAFDTAAGRMIHWWASCFARTGDADCLEWAQRMADKWQAVQHAGSGLVPNFFGAVASKEGAPMPPGKWAEARGTALMAESLLDAVHELRKRPEGGALAEQLTRMATRLALGTARYSYDPQHRFFREVLHLDGRPYLETARYTFRTQEEKDAAVKKDPLMAQVRVYDGAGFYAPPSYWEQCAGTNIPDQLSHVAAMTKNRELVDCLRLIAAHAVEASRKQASEFTRDGVWTFRASGRYVKMLVRLWKETGERKYLDWAEEMADTEIARLRQVASPDWWRLPERAVLLDALLMLHAELVAK